LGYGRAVIAIGAELQLGELGFRPVVPPAVIADAKGALAHSHRALPGMNTRAMCRDSGSGIFAIMALANLRAISVLLARAITDLSSIAR